MHNVLDLINKLCPSGVPFIELDSMAEIGTGRSDRKDAKEDGKYPFYVRSKEVFRIDNYEYDETAIVIPGEGGIGEIFHFVEGKYALHQRAYRIHVIDKKLNPRYLYYFMFSQFKNFIMKKAVSATVTSIRKPMIQKFLVAVPPLEIQNEIVRILDSFTELTSELTEKLTDELVAHKKRYEYYMNYLLIKQNNVKYKKLNEIFNFRNGLSKGKEYFGSGIPFIRYTDVYNKRVLHKEDITALVECSEDELIKLKVSRGDVFFTRTSETAEDVGWSSVMLDDLNSCVFNGFTIKATPKTDDLLPEYCAYCFSSYEFRDYVARKCSFTTRASLTGSTIGEYLIAIPTHDEQKKIVDILNNFEAGCKEIYVALSGEIEARKKQYEYYRDKLLTFKELSI